MFALPVLFIFVAWRAGSWFLKRYTIANAILYLIFMPVMSGATTFPLVEYRGILQRVAALVMYVPIGVMAAVLLRANRSRGGST